MLDYRNNEYPEGCLSSPPFGDKTKGIPIDSAFDFLSRSDSQPDDRERSISYRGLRDND